MTALRVMSSVVIKLSTRRERWAYVFLSCEEALVGDVGDLAEGWVVDEASDLEIVLQQEFFAPKGKRKLIS